MKKPSDNPFYQQRIRGYRPSHSYFCTSSILLTLGLSFSLLGAFFYWRSNSLSELVIPYNNDSQVQFTLSEEMEAPIEFYYGLDNFYQNHRLYVRSLSYEQLRGEDLGVESISKCDPITTVSDLDSPDSLDGTTMPPRDPANPCGLIAKSVFNDTFSLMYEGITQIFIDENSIAWQSDRDNLFSRNLNFKTEQWIDVEDEHFIVWMRLATLPKFHKLWGTIFYNLKPGTYTLNIENNYNVSEWDGNKEVLFLSPGASVKEQQNLGSVLLVSGGSFLVGFLFFLTIKCKVF